MKLRTPFLAILALLGAAACNVDADGDGHFAHEDCDDTQATIFPGADETCDGLDNNCNGIVDDDTVDAPVFFADFDRDTFGDPDNTTSDCRFDADSGQIDPDFEPYGYVKNSEDCNDTLKTVFPGADERCDEIDNDCDGDIDEDDAINKSTWYEDKDGDLFGNHQETKEACDAPDGFVGNDDDCNDDAKESNPGATEICDGDDNDCDGETDEDDALDAKPYYADTDGDKYGDKDNATFACAQPEDYVEDDTDCDDEAETAYPGGTEVCDGLDNDCDESTSEAGLIGLNWGTTNYDTIQAAINDSSEGDTVSVCAGEYNEDLYISKPLTLEGPGGSDATTLTGSGEGSVIFFEYDGSSADHTVKGFTISGGFGEAGGAISADEVDSFVGEDLVLTGNSAGWGGGLSADNADLTNVDFIDNEAEEIGGGAVIFSGTMDRVRFIDNMAAAGGGLVLWGGVLEASNTRIISNYASEGAAGMYMLDGAEVTGITILNNLTDGIAGGVYIEDGGSMSDSEVSRNRAMELGGGIVTDWETTISNTTIDGNKAPEGAGVYAAGDIDFDTCDMDGNEASVNGGAMYIDGADVTMTKGSVTTSSAKLGGGAYIDEGSLDVTNAEFGTGTEENSPDDVYAAGSETAYSSYGSGATFSCDEDSCI